MANENHHEELIGNIARQLEPILKKSKQAVYIYLDDVHKVCNDNFAKMLGYESVGAWAETEAPLADVVEEDQKAVISAYQNAVDGFMASQLEITMRNVNNDKLVKVRMIVVPIVLDGHVFSIHFLSQL
jgi:hypothetical protein